VNAVAPGIVDTPMHANDPKDLLKALRRLEQISDVKDIIDAIVYLTEASQVTGRFCTWTVAPMSANGDQGRFSVG
jgi:NAD(P)-dependent dehydrogenase (short-subunit alcohol dehydrogenase family)